MNPLNLLKKPSEEAASEESQSRADQTDSQMLQGGEIFSQDSHILGAVMSPKNTVVLSKYISLRDIQLSGLDPASVLTVVMFCNQIVFLDTQGYITWAQSYAELFESWLCAMGAVGSRTFNGITVRKGEIIRTNRKL